MDNKRKLSKTILCLIPGDVKLQHHF